MNDLCGSLAVVLHRYFSGGGHECVSGVAHNLHLVHEAVSPPV